MTTQDYPRFVELLQSHAALTHRLGEIESRLNLRQLAAAGDVLVEFVIINEDIALLDTAIKDLFLAHPEWRGAAKSVSTPFGAVESRSSTEIDVPNEPMTVALIQARGKTDPEFKADLYLRVTIEPNVEALESLDDSALEKLGGRRVKKETVTVKPAKVKAGAAIKAAQAAAKKTPA
jgi:hypothetical protein